MAEGNRKLAAIMSADVVGYSRLMAADEPATVRLLQEYRAAIARVVERHKGRVVNAPGDNILSEFPSAVEAVESAHEIQQVLKGRNLELAPEKRMELRIGINLGDVIEEADGTIYGDGVNLAARMEALAEAGGICISSSVYEAVEGKLELGFDFLGARKVKNIDRPINVYRVRAEQAIEAPSALKPRRIATVIMAAAGLAIFVGILLWSKVQGPVPDGSVETANDSADQNLASLSGPTVAVLPFQNLSGDPDQDFFADGISEDVLNQLSPAMGIQVISRSSSFRYRGADIDVAHIGAALGAHFLVVGGVRMSADTVRVTAELVEVATAKKVWSNAYDRDLTMSQLFAVQDDIAQSIVATIADEYGVISQLTRERARDSTASLSSYECILRAYHYFERATAADHLVARTCLEEAVEKDPDYAEAWGWLAILYANEHAWGFNTNPDPLGRSLAAGNKAVAIDRSSQMAWEGKAAAHYFRGERDEFGPAAQKAIELNPNDVSTIANMSWYYGMFGDYDAALPLLDRAIALSPYPPHWYFHTYWAKYFSDGDYETALEYALKSEIDVFFMPHLLLAATNAELGDIAQSAINVKKLKTLKPDIGETYTSWAQSLHWPQDLIERVAQSLNKAGVPIDDSSSLGE